MAIESARIAAGPTTWRRAVPIQPLPVATSDITTLTPDFEGQLMASFTGIGSQKMALLYVGVDISGTLEFKKVKTTFAINGYTGKPFDPMGGIRNSTLN